MHNLTYQERARFAYANGNTELAEALEHCAELETENERLVECIWNLEDALDKVTT
jgi:phage shock protein A